MGSRSRAVLSFCPPLHKELDRKSRKIKLWSGLRIHQAKVLMLQQCGGRPRYDPMIRPANFAVTVACESHGHIRAPRSNSLGFLQMQRPFSSSWLFFAPFTATALKLPTLMVFDYARRSLKPACRASPPPHHLAGSMWLIFFFFSPTGINRWIVLLEYK
jgi:hypothetical protein